MSHEPRRNDRPDFNEIFKHELGPCKAPIRKPKDTTPEHLRPGNPAGWDDHAKYYADHWRLELIKELEGGAKTPPKDLADACEEYARLCFVYGSAGEVVPLAKMTLRQLGQQPIGRQREGLAELKRVYLHVIKLADGCGFHAEANVFIRYAIELGELIDRMPLYQLHNTPRIRPPVWQDRHLDLADCCLKLEQIDEALRALDDGVDACARSDLRSLQVQMELAAIRIAFHHGKRPDAFRRCLEVIEHYDPKAPNQLPAILTAKGLYEEFSVEG